MFTTYKVYGNVLVSDFFRDITKKAMQNTHVFMSM